MWPFNLLYPSRNRRQHGAGRPRQLACRPRRAVVSLGLEPLEERCLLNAASTPTPTPTPSPPSQFQAILSLYLDGAYLQTQSLANQYIPNLMGYYDVPSTMAGDTAAAAAAGINLDAVLSLNTFLGSINSGSTFQSSGVIADLQFNWQYAGALAPYGVTAGAQAALQAVKQ